MGLTIEGKSILERREPPPAKKPAALNQWDARSTKDLSRVLAAVSGAIGLVAMAGRALGVPLAASWLPGQTAMHANTALALVLASSAFLLIRSRSLNPVWRRMGDICAVAVTLIGALTLIEYIFRINLGLDQLLFKKTVDLHGAAFPGRMAPNSALNLMLLGLAIFFLDRDSRKGAWRAGPPVVLFSWISLFGLVSYLYRVDQFHPFAAGAYMALNTAVAFCLMAGALFASRPDRSLVAVAQSGGAGGTLFRRFFPAAVFLTLGLGWLRVVGQRNGFLTTETGTAFVFTTIVMLLGAVVYWLGVLLVRKEADLVRTEQMRRAGAYNRSLIEASLDPLVTIGKGGEIADVNSATETATGWSRELLIGADFSDFFTQPAVAKAGYERAFREGSVRDYPLEILHKDGHVTPVLYNATVYRGEDGEVMGVFAAARDVSEHKRSEAALKRAAAYNRNLIEASLDPLVTIGPDGRITDVNGATEKITGLSRNRLIGTDFADYFTDSEKAKIGYLQVYRDGAVHDYALELRGQDGHITPVLYNAAVYREEDGKIAGVFAAARDVGALKRAEENVRKLNSELEERVTQRTAQLEAANKELESFAYSISHDLRAPLRAVDGYSTMLVEDYGPKLDAECRRLLGIVRESAVQMGQLIDDLLSFSRMGRQDLLTKPADMRAIVNAAVENVAKDGEGRRVRLEISELPPCEGDFVMLKQVWTNLLSNALKFTRMKDEAVINIGASLQNGETVYWIKDNGVGFDMTYADKLFKVFQRLHRATEYEGTGIGLAIVARIVARHRGRVWAEAKPGEGAKFSFTLGGEKV